MFFINIRKSINFVAISKLVTNRLTTFDALHSLLQFKEILQNQILSKSKTNKNSYTELIQSLKSNFMFRTIYQHQSWHKRIQPVLKQMASGKMNHDEIIERIKQFQKLTHVKRTYSGAKNQNWSMQVLSSHYKSEISKVFPKIAQFILQFEEGYEPKIPIFYANKVMEYSFSKRQMFLLMCMMSFCLVPPQQYEGIKEKQTKFNHLKNFSHIYSFEKFKTIGIIQYLKKEVQELSKKQQKEEYLTLKRLVTQLSLKQIVTKHSEIPMSKVSIQDNSSDIEDHYGNLKIDFANKYIGGGALIHGGVQEEIMFAVHPQMYTSILLCEVMHDHESLEYVGFKKYFKSSGYGHNVAITGFNDHKYEYDEQQRARQFISAIDAINFPRVRQLHQFSNQAFQREVIKAYTGFNTQQGEKVASGNWGCGVFGGDLCLKFLIQWFAASLCGKQLIYCPFGKKMTITNKILFERLQVMSIGKVYEILSKGLSNKKGDKMNHKNVYESIIEILKYN